MSNLSAIVAIAKGATYFEKHITWNNKSKGPDHFYACEIKKFKDYVSTLNSAYSSLGKKDLVLDDKIIYATRRKSYHAIRKIHKNEKLNFNNLYLKQNLSGLNINEIKKYIGKKLKKNINKDKPIKQIYF